MADSTWQMANGKWQMADGQVMASRSSPCSRAQLFTIIAFQMQYQIPTLLLYCTVGTILLYYYTSKMPALHPPRRVLYLGLSATDPSSNPPTSAHCSFMPRHHHAVLILLMLMLMLILTTTTTTTTVLLLLLFFPCSTLLPFATA